ncbi:unnamed protein product [Rotaria socialis]|uniref:AB hydrolase-1 domain-containing protein n=1 Tax=Rotaria socialis TaxID=392032 RepID=A0A820QLJ7_9BILA|nr:unnamed protein product [Rotaria socialis]CAF4424682.1 unnamed protein product [Rotaria socialis]
MNQIFTIILLIGFISQRVYSQTTFNATAYALSHPCLWTTCNVTGFSIGNPAYILDCCTLQLPLNYAQPNQTIPISMSRLSPNQTNQSQNTVVMLSGGPGGSGWNLFSIASIILQTIPGITVILPDHRGTGLSSVLSCDDYGSQDISAACITYLVSKWGTNGLNQFSITNAAHDVSVQIQSYQATNPGRVGLFAVSYGTLWADRFLQIYPTVVQASVMDGVFDPLTSSDSRAPLLTDAATVQFLSYCRLQIKCNQYFSAEKSPVDVLKTILKQVDLNQQKCIKENFANYQLTSYILRNMFLTLITDAGQYFARTIVPAVIYRLNRCNADDITVLKFFFQNTATLTTTAMPAILFSSVLSYNIVQSETWLAMNESEIDETTYNDWRDSTIMTLTRPSNFFTLRAQWPKYPLDQYYGNFAAQAPVLMLSGELDPSTVFQQASHIASITRATRIFYAVPLTGHVTSSIMLVGYPCPAAIALYYLFPNIVPAAYGDPKCLQSLPTTIDFVGETAAVQQVSSKLLNITLPFGSGPASPYNGSLRMNAFQNLHILQIFLCLILSIIFQ